MSLSTTFRIVLLAALIFGAAILAWLLWPTRAPVAIPPGISSANAGMAERGAYLVRAGGCVTCHWDKKSGGQPFAGGLAIASPFGTFYTPNITPDKATGIGKWNDEDFVRALTQGEGIHGEQLYPALPYTSYSRMTAEDALAIKAHLMTLAPVNAPQKPNELPVPFSWRPLLKAWKFWFFAGASPLGNDPTKNPAWNRGRYLVTALSHCAECHTPRSGFGAMIEEQNLQGNRKGPGNWKVPALVGPAAKDFDSWSVDETAEYLKSGVKPDFDSAQGPMAEVIEDDTKHLTDEDRRAIALYLKALNTR